MSIYGDYRKDQIVETILNYAEDEQKEGMPLKEKVKNIMEAVGYALECVIEEGRDGI